MKTLLLLLILLAPLSAKITLIEDSNCYKNFSIEYYYDTSNKLPIKDLDKKPFKTLSNNFTLGYLTGTAWFKIVLENNSSKENYILTFSETLWKTFNLYRFQKDHWEVDRNGLDIPLAQRSFKSVYPTFKITMPKNTRKVFYIQANTVAGQLGEFKVCTQEAYLSELR